MKLRTFRVRSTRHIAKVGVSERALGQERRYRTT